MDKVGIDILASTSFESDLLYLSSRVYDDVMGRIGSTSLFDNSLKANRKNIYEMETAKVVLERTLENVNKKLNAMYDAYNKEGE